MTSDIVLIDKGIVKVDSDGSYRGEQKKETMLFNYRSKEMFFNLKEGDIPPKGHVERGDFIRHEKEKVRNGVTINGIYICGSLYYHWNYHTIAADYKDATGRIIRVRKQPDLRDNDWEIHNEYYKAQKEQQAFCLGGARQLGKSESLVSMSMRELFVYRDSEVMGLFSIDEDKDTYTKKMQVAIEDRTRNFLVIPPIDKDFNKKHIRFGYTLTDNENSIYSNLFMYLTSGGTNTEVGAGKTTTFFFIDEIAKRPVKLAYEAVLPAIRGEFGFRCSPLLMFTGGNVEKGQDAKDLFFNPEANNIRTYTNDNKSTGYFMSATHRQDFKNKILISDYLGVKIPKKSELYDLKIAVSDIERAKETLAAERALAEKDTNPTTLTKKKVYDPLTIDEIFLSVGGKPFADYAERLHVHKDMLRSINRGRLVDILWDGDTPRWADSQKRTINHFPKKEYELSDCAVVMYEPPLQNNHYWLHAGGFDPYNTSVTATSSSHGSFYLMRREYSDLGDAFKDTMVVSLYSRPEKMSELFKTIRGILMIYNGTMLHEVSNDLVLNYFDIKGEAERYLCKTWNLAQEINPNNKAKSSYGLPPTTKNQEHVILCIKEYLSEVIGFTNEGKEILGYTRILDPLLCEEIIDFSETGNFDRIWGFGHAIAYCKYLDKYNKVEEERKPRTDKPKVIHKSTPFSMGSGGSFVKYRK